MRVEMAYCKIYLVTLLAILISLSSIIQVQGSTTTKDTKANVTTTTSLLANSTTTNSDPIVAFDTEETPAILGFNTTRAGRVMKVLNDLKTIRKRTRIPSKILARADYFPPPPSLGRQQSPPAAAATGHRLPPFLQRRPQFYAGPYSAPQIHRRVHNSLGTNLPRFPNYELLKNSRFSLAKSGHQYPSGKGSVYRPQFAGQQHPNAVSSIMQQPQHYGSNFKASPTFNGKTIVRPVKEQQEQQYPPYAHQQQQQQLQQLQQYQPVKQYPIPEKPQRNHQQQLDDNREVQRDRENLLATGYQAGSAVQQIQSHYKQPPRFHYEQTKPYQEAQVKYENPERLTYSVYEEEPGHTEQRLQIPINQAQQEQQPAYNHNYYVSSTEIAAKEAQEYLKFMSSKDYFLPKHEPNYKQLDADSEQRLGMYHQQQPSQSQQSSHHSNKYSKPISEANTNNPSIEVSQFFYQEEPAGNSAIVRGSYQAGNNLFVVNSDGNKGVKHIVQNPLPAIATQVPTTSAPIYSQPHYNPVRSRTPEPQRFEFTERDAVTSSYTNSPIAQQKHLRYKSVGVPSTPRDPLTVSTGSIIGTSTISSYNDIVHEHDVEDDDDMQEAGSNTFGRVQVHSGVATSSESPIEQKDTEDYCERICANVEDEDEEIVCGSDGYMYTSESQMECYSSCLHIDVTIQSRGVCNSS